MKEFNSIYVVALLVGVILVISFFFKRNNSVTFYGFAENRETQINMEEPIEVSHIRITNGQKVKKGDVLIDVFSSILPVKINDAKYSIEELETKYDLWKSDLDGRIRINNILLNEKTSEIQAEIDQHYAQLNKNKKLSSTLKSITLNETKKSTIENPILIKIKSLKKELRYAENTIKSQIKNLENELNAPNNPLLSRIKILNKELDYYNVKKQKETIVAPSNGVIGNIHCKKGEKIPSFKTLVTFYEENPTLVIGYVHEELLLKVGINDTVTVFSTSRPDIQNVGVVKTLGSRIIEIPSRIRKIKDLKIFGREVIIEIPSENPFLQKEKVTLELNQ